jgi:2-polyprenyl-3-methyl-5-hydroxy-6-metoxy-1,4-benzoquinol methylase
MVLDEIASNDVLRVPLVSSSNDTHQNDDKEQVAEHQSSSILSSSLPVPKSNAVYGSKDYWEERFSQEKDYEWLLSYQQLSSQLIPFLQPTSRILVVGCGNSPFSADMYDAGYHNIVNIDYSETVISAMKKRHCSERPAMEWRVMDMTDLSELADESFDVVIDKAAMDAMMTAEGDVWNPSQKCVDQSRSMCGHVSRILVQGGHFLQVSLS